MPVLTEPSGAADQSNNHRYVKTARRYTGWFSPEPPPNQDDVKIWLLMHADVPDKVKKIVNDNLETALVPMSTVANDKAMHYIYACGRMVISYI